jgi:hypothetical protein
MKNNSKTKTLILGAIIGALAGAASAYLLIKRAEDADEDPQLTPGEGLQLGLGILGLMRLIAGRGKD